MSSWLIRSPQILRYHLLNLVFVSLCFMRLHLLLIPQFTYTSPSIYTSQGFVDISLLCTFKRMRDLLGIKEADTTKEKMPQSLLSAVSAMAARCSVATKQLPPDASALTSIMQLMSRLCTSRYRLTSLTCRS